MQVLVSETDHYRRDPAPLVIGLVNNMPDAALRATEQQFRRLMDAAAGDRPVWLRMFYLPGVRRGEAAHSYIRQNYASLDVLERSRLDGLIVTGAPPSAACITGEPYWPDLERLIGWARSRTCSSIWCCLAAYAAVLHLDGISRRALPAKLSGIFDCEVEQAEHPLMRGLPPRWSAPHSRHYELPEEALTQKGYRILSRSAQAGADIFVKHEGSLFVFLQGHLEYDAQALLREYRRDVRKFLSGSSAVFPETPVAYFDASTEAALCSLRARAECRRDIDLLSCIPELPSAGLAQRWDAPAVGLYRNWLAYIERHRRRLRAELDVAAG